MKKNYGNDRASLKKHFEPIELQDGPRRVLVAPQLQGRVMTSTAAGEEGRSFGWINYRLIESGEHLPHCNNFGGEDRYWLGPEGGQYSIFFPEGTDFGFDDWQTPPAIDTEPWDVTASSEREACFVRDMRLTNTSGTRLECRAQRKVMLLSPERMAEELGDAGLFAGGINGVGFASENRLTNTGDATWTEETGMLSVWILGQFVPSDRNTIIIPFRRAEGCAINDAYFGKIGDDRLKVEGNILLFRGDGGKRGKIGVPPQMTVPVIGAYDAENGVLTVVKFSFDPSVVRYVNSMWERQEKPFAGDTVNSYNDGPLEDGSIMGPFYELETSSPAAALAQGQSLVHTHATFHLTGSEAALDGVARRLWGIGLTKMPW